MSIVLGDNIEYKGKKPLDSRMLFDTIAEMKAYSENYLPDITLAFNKEDSKMYVFNRENEVDTTTGKWRVFEGGDGGTESVYLTQAEFDTLTPAEQDDPTKDYYITSNGQPVPAEGIKITDMDDVSVTAPLLDDETLVFDEDSQVFKNKNINDYVKTKIDKTLTLPGPNTSDANYFGMLIPKSDIKSITIDFDTEETSYPRAIYKINGEIAVNTPLVLITSGTGVVGQPLELNHHFTGNEILAVGGPNGIHFKYGQQNHSEYKLISIKDGPYIKGVLNGYYMKCTYTYEVYTDKYNTNDLTGKKIMLLGDSLTQSTYSKRGDILAEKNGMIMDNKAVSGSYVYNDETSQYKNRAIYKRICVPSATNYIPDSAFEDVDYIIVYGGTNDARYGVTVGDVDSTDPGDFCGALNAICDTLQTRAPSAHIGFITTFPYTTQFQARHKAVIQATKDVCAKYCIPVFDQSTESGINRNNATIVSTLTREDGLHLNDDGNAFVEQKYEAFIRRI